jgi:hypothetical protein
MMPFPHCSSISSSAACSRAGGGIRGGMVYGESDKIGAYVKDKPVRPQDLGATIYHALGVPLELRLGKDGFTRPISSGQPILGLFG